jgi:hypothetical protein
MGVRAVLKEVWREGRVRGTRAYLDHLLFIRHNAAHVLARSAVPQRHHNVWDWRRWHVEQTECIQDKLERGIWCLVFGIIETE